jgi:hypothetical protein
MPIPSNNVEASTAASIHYFLPSAGPIFAPQHHGPHCLKPTPLRLEPQGCPCPASGGYMPKNGSFMPTNETGPSRGRPQGMGAPPQPQRSLASLTTVQLPDALSAGLPAWPAARPPPPQRCPPRCCGLWQGQGSLQPLPLGLRRPQLLVQGRYGLQAAASNCVHKVLCLPRDLAQLVAHLRRAGGVLSAPT